MNNIQFNQLQSTFPNAVIVAGVIAQLCSQHIGTIDEQKILPNISYHSTSNSATYTRMTNAMTGEFSTAPDSFESVISRFYTSLLSNQEPLGADFEAVLNDNLWDLYES